MNPGIFAEFMKRRGFTVRKMGGLYCYSVNRFMWQTFPYHKAIEPTKEDLREAFRASGPVGIRFTVPVSAPGKDSYYVACADKNYYMKGFSQNFRHNTKRGIARCRVERVDFDFLYDKGQVLQVDTLVRQGRDTGIFDLKKWRAYCTAAKELPGFEAWGSFVEDELTAFLVTFKMDECMVYILQRSLKKHLSSYPNNAITHVVTKDALSRPDVDIVSYGLKSLHAPESLDDYKIGMGFVKMPVRERVAINPLYRPVFNGFTGALLSRLARNRDSEAWKKMSAMLELI